MMSPERDDFDADLDTHTAPSNRGDRHPMAAALPYRRAEHVLRVPVEAIELEGYYSRKVLREEPFEALKRSIAERGEVETPLLVRSEGAPAERRFILVAGYRRLRAAREVGLEEVLIQDLGKMDPQEALLAQGRENEVREDLVPVDQAAHYAVTSESGVTNARLAEAWGRSKGYVSVMVRTGHAVRAADAEERSALVEAELGYSDFAELTSRLGARATPRELLEALLARARGDRADTGSGTSPETPSSGKASPTPSTRRGGPFTSKQHRDGGRTFQVRWKPADLDEDPASFLHELAEHLEAEIEMVVGEVQRRVAETSAGGGAGGRSSDEELDEELERALDRLQRTRERLRQEGTHPPAAGPASGAT